MAAADVGGEMDGSSDMQSGDSTPFSEADTVIYLVCLLQDGYSQKEAHEALATSTPELLARAVAQVEQ